jgi:LysR family glycine cleavage system transcriptional activator
MKPPIPSTETLRAFDAAARLGSFSRAAQAVHLTHGAVSRRIAELEAQFKMPLFERLPRGVRLTAAGERLQAIVAEVLATLAGAVEDLRLGPRPRRVVRVSLLPSFASRWLLPRLAPFRALHPEIEIQLIAELGLADFARERVDLAIRYGLGRWPRVTVEPLMAETLCPVVAGGAGRLRLIARPQDLDGETILHDLNEDAWDGWFNSLGWRPSRARSESYNDYTLALEAAAIGLGIAMGRSRLTEIDLRSGRLRPASAFEVPNPKGYYLVTPRRPPSEEATIFIAWLRLLAARETPVGIRVAKTKRFNAAGR